MAKWRKFWENLESSSKEALKKEVLDCVSLASSCIEWPKERNKDGYGIFRIKGEPPLAAHRVIYELFVAPIPDGVHICHICDNPPCVNPSHLFQGNQLINMQNSKLKGRHISLKSKREFSPEEKKAAFSSLLKRLNAVVGV